MRSIILTGVVFAIVCTNTGCIKDEGCQDKTLESEAGIIAAYAASNGITGTVHSTGVYYQIMTQGSGPSPTALSQVSVRYTGKLLNGTVFDSQTGAPVTFSLGNTIHGFQIGLQLINKGGRIKMIIPSSLAYGCDGNGSIPANAILYFEVELVDVI